MDVRSVYVKSPSLWDRVGLCLKTYRTTKPHNRATVAPEISVLYLKQHRQPEYFISQLLNAEGDETPKSLQTRTPHLLSLQVVLTGWGPGLCQTVPVTADCLMAGCLRKAAGQLPWSFCFGDGVGALTLLLS